MYYENNNNSGFLSVSSMHVSENPDYKDFSDKHLKFEEFIYTIKFIKFCQVPVPVSNIKK